MTASEATAQVFVTAIKALKKADREAVLSGIADDRELREDLFDLATFAERADEPSRPFSEYERERKKKAR